MTKDKQMTREELDELRAMAMDELAHGEMAPILHVKPSRVLALLDHIDAQDEEITDALMRGHIAGMATGQSVNDALALQVAEMRATLVEAKCDLETCVEDHTHLRALDACVDALALTPSEAEIRVTKMREALTELSSDRLECGLNHEDACCISEAGIQVIADEALAPSKGGV